MPHESFEVGVDRGRLGGTVVGRGAPVLVLHGGPGIEWTYLQPLVDELAAGYQVAVYQQRGVPPSTARAPYDVATQVADALAVLDGLGWEKALVAGHSWGGHLLLHLLGAHPERIAAALAIDTLGAVGDGGEAEFDAEMRRRTPAHDLERVDELERQSMAGTADEGDLMESFRLLWPAYFAHPAATPPFPGVRWSPDAYAATFESLHAELPGLAARLGGIAVPTVLLHGAGSPMPVTASTDTAAAIGSAAVLHVLGGAGHFPWIERPGALRTVLDRLVRRAGRTL